MVEVPDGFPRFRETRKTGGNRGKRKRADDRKLSAARELVRERSNGRCELMGLGEHPDGCDGRASEVHHVLPRSLGGEHHIDNLLHLSKVCHDHLHANPEKNRRLLDRLGALVVALIVVAGVVVAGVDAVRPDVNGADMIRSVPYSTPRVTATATPHPSPTPLAIPTPDETLQLDGALRAPNVSLMGLGSPTLRDGVPAPPMWLSDLINDHAASYGWGVDDEIAAAMIAWKESRYQPDTQDVTTAFGLWQLLDSSRRAIGCIKSADPDQQTRCAFEYIDEFYGSPIEALEHLDEHGVF